MIRIILLYSLILSVYAVGPILSMTRRMFYSRTQYLLPCNVCTNALLYQSYSPSHTFMEFEKKLKKSCSLASSIPTEQHACVAILTKYSHPLVKDQMKGVSFQRSCVSTFNTNCIETEAKFAVMCDQRKKKGQCQVIPV